MATAENILAVYSDCGKRQLPLEGVYRQLYRPDLYLRAYGKLYRNSGAMTPGSNTETVDAMSLEKIDRIIDVMRREAWQWTNIWGQAMQNDHQSSESVILGVDTHLDIHVGAVISQAGKLLGTHIIQTNQSGYLELLDWARTFGILERAGIEGTGTYGAALTRYLIKNGIYVVEVNRPDRSKRRLEGKSDPLDAENAARTVLSGSSKAIPKMQPGACEALRIISVARRSAVKARTQAINQLRALLVSAPQDVRDKLWKSKPHECVAACINSEVSECSPLRIALCSTLRSLAKRWMALTEELNELDESLDKLTRKYASNFRRQFGVGPQTAATLLAVAGDNPELNRKVRSAYIGIDVRFGSEYAMSVQGFWGTDVPATGTAVTKLQPECFYSMPVAS